MKWNWDDNVNNILSRTNNDVEKIVKQVLGETKGKRFIKKETWWWNEEVQKIIQKKRVSFKEWQKSKNQEDLEKYKKLKSEVKNIIRNAQQNALDNLYSKLGTKEGEKEIYKLAKNRDRLTRDMGPVKCIKDINQNILINDKEILDRWEEYFQGLLNEEYPKKYVENIEQNIGMVHPIIEKEVDILIRKMEKNKAVDPDKIPIEV